MRNERKFAFLGESFPRFAILVVIATIGLIAEKVINYRYVVVQKAVQGGNVYENWEVFMNLTGLTIMISLILMVVKIFFTMLVEMVQKVNMFKTCNGIIQEKGMMEGCLKLLTVANAKVYCVIDSIETIINSAYIVVLMGVVSMSVPEYIGAVAILLAGISLGVVRGSLQAKTDLLGAGIQTMQQKLSGFFMISFNVLYERLKELEGMYWMRIALQCIKNVMQQAPNIVKVMAFIAIFYNIPATGMAEGEIYPYTYVVLTAYGYIVNFASNISNIIESVSKIMLYKRDPELREIEEVLKKREQEIAQNRESVTLTEEGLRIEKSLKLALRRANGEMLKYKLLNALCIKPGEVVEITGANGGGKSRLVKIFWAILEAVLYYCPATEILENVSDNFKCGKESMDFNCIKYLAKGLDLERIPETKDEFMKLKLSSVNDADRQMLVALQMLYFAIKDSERGKPQLVILDEILANVSLEKTQKVLPFMVNELKKIGACTIIISHTHKEEVRKYTTATWQLYVEGREVIIKAE